MSKPGDRSRASRTTRSAVIAMVSGLVALAAFAPGIVPNSWKNLVGLGAHRLAPVVSAPASDAHEFLRTNRDGSPVTWDPCKPIPYVVNPAGAPAYWRSMVSVAVRAVEAATGLRFADEGVVDWRPDPRTGASGEKPDADRPVLISWSTPDEVPRLEGDIAGVGGPGIETRGAVKRLRSGGVTLDEEIRPGVPPSRPAAQAVLLHELGHLVGLAHTHDPHQLMSAKPAPRVRAFQIGDRAGLARLGTGECR